MPLSAAMWGARPLRRVRFLLCLALVWFTLSALRGVDLKNKVPHIIAQTRLVWNKKKIARFHPHKRHLYEASQQPIQCKLQVWIAKRNCTAFAIFQIPSRRNRTRRAHEVSRIVAQKLFTRENMGFRAIPSSPASLASKQPFQYTLRAWITKCDGTARYGFYFLWRSGGSHCHRCTPVIFARTHTLRNCIW